MGHAQISPVKVTVSSECVIRPAGVRAHVGDEVEITQEEYERLLKAGCIDQLSKTMAIAPEELASRQNPAPRRARGR